jgi:hypothetical protein
LQHEQVSTHFSSPPKGRRLCELHPAQSSVAILLLAEQKRVACCKGKLQHILLPFQKEATMVWLFELRPAQSSIPIFLLLGEACDLQQRLVSTHFACPSKGRKFFELRQA